MVLNQCVSMLMIQSQAATEELTAKNTRNQADSERLRNQYDVDGSRSSASIFFRICTKHQYQRPKNSTMRKRQKSGKLPEASGQKKYGPFPLMIASNPALSST